MLILFQLGLPSPLLTPGQAVEGSKPSRPYPLCFRLLHAALTAFPLFSQLARQLRGSNTLAHSCIRNAHPKHKHIPEAKVRSQELS